MPIDARAEPQHRTTGGAIEPAAHDPRGGSDGENDGNEESDRAGGHAGNFPALGGGVKSRDAPRRCDARLNTRRDARLDARPDARPAAVQLGRMPLVLRRLAIVAAVVCSRPSGGQASVRGQVLAGAARAPLRTAWVSVLRDGRRIEADSAGRYVVPALALGTHRFVVGAAGFRPETTEVDLDVDMLEVAAVVLQPAVQALEGVTVTTTGTSVAGRLSGFDERRRFGNGTFIDRTMLERFYNRQTADVLQALAPGVSVRRGTSRKAWAATSRAPFTSGGAFGQAGGSGLDRSDVAAGARSACYMDVYLNGSLV